MPRYQLDHEDSDLPFLEVVLHRRLSLPLSIPSVLSTLHVEMYISVVCFWLVLVAFVCGGCSFGLIWHRFDPLRGDGRKKTCGDVHLERHPQYNV